MPELGPPSEVAGWRAYACWLIGSFSALVAAALAFIVLIGPYSPLPLSLPIARPPLDGSLRFYFSAIPRSGQFDSYILGTSTVRSVDPRQLAASLGGRFANLGIHGSTPWEQILMANLVIDQPRPLGTLVFALDNSWCDPDARAVGHSADPAPEWLYDDEPWNDLLYLLNIRALDAAVRRVKVELGMQKVNVRDDGFSIDTPPEETYDLAKARRRIWERQARQRTPIPRMSARNVPVASSPASPALTWLDAALARLAPDTARVLVIMPVHASGLPEQGSAQAAALADCKAAIAEIGRAHRATVVDFRFGSDLTLEDANYWDRVHFRAYAAAWVADAIIAAHRDGRSTPISELLHRP